MTRRSAGTAKFVELILARTPDADRLYFEKALRRDLNNAKILFRIVEPKALGSDPNRAQSFTPAQLAEAIRTAVARGASGLIVEPMEDPAVLDALYEADGRGAAVLLLDRPVAPRGERSLRCIRYAPFAPAGRQIVQAALEASKLLRQPEDARIILLHHRSADSYAAERRASLAEPLEAARRPFDVLEFEGDSTSAVAALKTALDAGPKVAIVLADEGQGMSAAYQVLSEWTKADHPEFLFGGYLAYDYRLSTQLLAQAVAFGDQSVESFAQRTFRTMQDLLAAKPVGQRVEVPIGVHKRQVFFVPLSP